MKKFITMMVMMTTMVITVFAESHFVVGPFNWCETYVTNNDEAIDLLQEYKGTNAEFVQYKERFNLNMNGPEAWQGYNTISRRYHTNKATMLKQVKKDVWAVFAFDNGELKYGNCFTIKEK